TIEAKVWFKKESWDYFWPPQRIPDFGNGELAYDVHITGTLAPPAEIRVLTDITHTYVGDLYFTIWSPDEKPQALTYGNGGGGDNFTNTEFRDDAALPIYSGSAPFTGPFQPQTLFSRIADRITTCNGRWVFELEDRAYGDGGYLNKLKFLILPRHK